MFLKFLYLGKVFFLGKVEKNSLHNLNYKKTTHLLFMDMEQKKMGVGKVFFLGKVFGRVGLVGKCAIVGILSA